MGTQIPDINVKELRKKLGLTQKEFAEKYHLSIRVVRGWEQLQITPSGAAKVLLFLIKEMPQAIENKLKKLG